jgi:rsbT co-antagonist protein RsbR
MADAPALGSSARNKLADLLYRREEDITASWLEHQENVTRRLSASERHEAERQSREFLELLRTAASQGMDTSTPVWDAVREFLTDLSAARAKGGYTPSETAIFILSLKQPLFDALREECGRDAEALAAEVWSTTQLLDSLSLLTTEAFQKTREQVISRQQQELLELATPVVQLWSGILALPLIGTLDSARTQVVMENLLDAIVKTRSDFAIIDITGVPVVDTLVAQHLLKTVAAARLMGAECMISGIRPQIAQTIIHLGVDLGGVITKATLADAFALALRRAGSSLAQDPKSGPAWER